MGEANVKNIEGLEVFAASLVSLRENTRKSADDVREQLQRVTIWLTKEMPEYWGNQLRLSQRRWTDAREDLVRCQAKTRAEDESSCLLQRKLLAKATERRNLCEQRVKSLPQLAIRWEQCIQEISLSARQLEDMSESSLPLAEARLQQAIQTLKQYLSNTSFPEG